VSDARAHSPDPTRGGAGDAALDAEDEAALAEELDLDHDMKRRILAAYRAIERQNHYELLAVDSKADARAIKRVYYQLAATFHPDRYFRKKLGTFKVRMEAVFGRLTLAYEALSDVERRAEYDAYLDEQRRSRSIEELLADALAEAKRAEESIEREVRARSPVASTSPPGSSQPPSATTPAKSVLHTPAPNVDLSARRDALARRLLGGRGPASSSTPPPRPSIAPPPMPTVADAMGALKRRYEERLARAKAAQARQYVVRGEAALESGDAVSAANAFRVAMSLSPTDPDLESAARDAQSKADDVLGEAYRRQAAYEEKNNQWPEASRSWSRVCRARPNDAMAHEHAARALTKAGGDLHEAARLAGHATELEPAVARHRVVLAEVYLAAGLTLNARREIETAAQLAPHDGTILEIMKRVGK
jgi:curved DNA-binding protein CbpA